MASDADSGISSDDVKELYETARRKALNVDEKIDSALAVLNRL
jgi:hypothetical protein